MIDWVNIVLEYLTAPLLYLVDPLRRVYWLYLLSAAVITCAVYLHQRKTSSHVSLRGLLAYAVPRRIYGHGSARLDYRFFYFNAILGGLILAPLVAAPLVAGTVADLLGGTSPAGGEPDFEWRVALTIATVVAMDLALYVGHRLQHRLPLLWEFHKVHHSAEALTPVTAFRVHPIDDLLNLSLTALFTGVVQGVFHVVAGTGVADIEVLGVNVILFAWYVFGFQLRHSHVWLAYPRWLSHILISPAQHQIHHSRAPRHFDRNMGFIFAFWDAIGGTLYVPAAKEDLTYGVAGETNPFGSVCDLYVRPFRTAFAIVWRSGPPDAVQARAAAELPSAS